MTNLYRARKWADGFLQVFGGVSLRGISCGFVCGINTRDKRIHVYQPAAIYHPEKFHHVCLLWKENGEELKSEVRPMRSCCAVALWCLGWASPAILALLVSQVKKMWLNLKALSPAFIHIVYILPCMASPAFSLLSSAFIRKMCLLFSVRVLIPFIQRNENALVG